MHTLRASPKPPGSTADTPLWPAALSAQVESPTAAAMGAAPTHPMHELARAKSELGECTVLPWGLFVV